MRELVCEGIERRVLTGSTSEGTRSLPTRTEYWTLSREWAETILTSNSLDVTIKNSSLVFVTLRIAIARLRGVGS
jgi:hypothetical protein